MCKKVLIASLAVVIGLAVIANTRVGSHVRLWWSGVKSSMARKIPAEREIQRLRMEVQRLEKDDARFYDLVAKQRIEARESEQQVAKNQETLGILRTRLTDLRALVKDHGKSEGQKVSYKGSDFTLAEINKQINLDWDRFEPLEALVESQEKSLAAKKAALAQNEKKLVSLEKTRTDMLTQLQALENELNELRQAKAGQAALLDDSSYGRVQRDIDAVKKRLEIEKERQKLIGTSGKGPVEKAEEARVREEERRKKMDAKLGGGAEKAVTTPAKN